MPTQVVIEKLRQLQGQLEQAPATPETDKLKKQVAVVLLEPEHQPHYGTLRERMTQALARLEADHPQLATAIQGVSNELAAYGL